VNSPESFDDLEAELRALGDSLDVPSPPPAEVAAAVRARLTQPPGAVARDRRRARWSVVVAVIVAVIAVTAATPQGRAVVTEVLRFAGVELRIGGDPAPATPPVTSSPTPGTSAPPTAPPGERAVTPAEARSLAPFTIRTPAALGPPQQVTVADDGRVVSMTWGGGVRLDQIDGTIDPIFFKQLGPDFPETVAVGQRDGWWIAGEHPLGYISRTDGSRVPLRQAGPTLLWQDGPVGYRLEGAGSKRRATEIAKSLR
jgi:hypothetical protein